MKVYLDNSGTTKAYDEVGDLVRKVLCEDFGNPSSMHYRGVESEQYIKEAKDTLAKILKVQQKEIFFTSGGTESDNWALIGAARANKRAGKHLIALYQCAISSLLIPFRQNCESTILIAFQQFFSHIVVPGSQR